jgi:hypothetical protein
VGVFFGERESADWSALNETDPSPGRRALGEADKPVFFYGAGKTFSSLLPFCKTLLAPRQPGGVLDNNPDLIGRRVEGLPVYHPGDPLVSRLKPLAVILTINPGYQAEMIADCRCRGYEYATSDQVLLWAGGAVKPEALEENPACREAFELWDDDESRKVYRGIVRAYATRNEAELPACETGWPQYFHPGFTLDQFRFFVDAGAYTGDTLRQFRRKVGDEYAAYYAFEPSAHSFPILLREAGGDPLVHCRREVLLDRESLVEFRENRGLLHLERRTRGGETPGGQPGSPVGRPAGVFHKNGHRGKRTQGAGGIAGHHRAAAAGTGGLRLSSAGAFVGNPAAHEAAGPVPPFLFSPPWNRAGRNRLLCRTGLIPFGVRERRTPAGGGRREDESGAGTGKSAPKFQAGPDQGLVQKRVLQVYTAASCRFRKF